MAWKVKVTIDGFGEVNIKVPRQPSRAQFGDAVASAVTQTLQLVYPEPTTHAFHPVLGQGGYSWDHANQRVVLREAQAPEVVLNMVGFKLRLRRMWNRLLRSSGSVRKDVQP